MGTDPDSDRLGIAARRGDDFVLVTGNQLGALLLDYVLSTRAELGTMPPRPVVMKTIVTTELHRRIAEAHGARCIDTLTGFKYMGEKIRQFESLADGPSYVFGSEESYGYLIGTHVRDKDAVTAAVVTVEMALYHKSRGLGVIDALEAIYTQVRLLRGDRRLPRLSGPAGHGRHGRAHGPDAARASDGVGRRTRRRAARLSRRHHGPARGGSPEAPRHRPAVVERAAVGDRQGLRL